MPGFLYYIPQGRGATAETLRNAGLAYSLNGDGVTTCHIGCGPDSGAGVIASIDRDEVDTRYVAVEQAWRKGDGGKFWLGYWKEKRPGPADLARPTLFEGTPVKLRDGNEWIIPRCYAPLADRPIDLPRILDLDDDGRQWQAKPAPEYAALCEDAFRVWEIFIGVRQNDLKAADELRIAVAALAVNYRVSALEIAALGLWSTEELAKVMRAIIDGDAVMAVIEAQKKTPIAVPPSGTASAA